MPIRILVVDDHAVVRQGVKTLLEEHPEWEVVGEAEDGIEAVERAALTNPDVVIMDISMPKMDGLAACRLIRKAVPQTEILVLTQHDSPQMMREALDAGARGYVVKSNMVRDLVIALTAVSRGLFFPDPSGGPDDGGSVVGLDPQA